MAPSSHSCSILTSLPLSLETLFKNEHLSKWRCMILHVIYPHELWTHLSNYQNTYADNLKNRLECLCLKLWKLPIQILQRVFNFSIPKNASSFLLYWIHLLQCLPAGGPLHPHHLGQSLLAFSLRLHTQRWLRPHTLTSSLFVDSFSRRGEGHSKLTLIFAYLDPYLLPGPSPSIVCSNLSEVPITFLLFCLTWDGIRIWLCCLGWPWTHVPPALASWTIGVTDMHHCTCLHQSLLAQNPYLLALFTFFPGALCPTCHVIFPPNPSLG